LLQDQEEEEEEEEECRKFCVLFILLARNLNNLVVVAINIANGDFVEGNCIRSGEDEVL